MAIGHDVVTRLCTVCGANLCADEHPTGHPMHEPTDAMALCIRARELQRALVGGAATAPPRALRSGAPTSRARSVFYEIASEHSS